jgi:hypothetical protein
MASPYHPPSLSEQTEVWYAEVWSLEAERAEVNKRHQVKILNRFAALEILDDVVGINRARGNIGQYIKISAKKKAQVVTI